MHPHDISTPEPERLVIRWANGAVSSIDGMALRRSCPCVECRTRQAMTTESYIPLLPVIAGRIRTIDLIGSSRLRVIWEDGHDRSIYPFADLLLHFPPARDSPNPA